MVKNKIRVVPYAVLLPSILVSAAVFAEDNQGPWKSEAEVGMVMTSGNTDTDTVKAKTKLVYDQDKWVKQASLDFLYTETDQVTTAERYRAKAQAKYRFSGIQYFYGNVQYEKDRFSGYEYRVSESLGYGATVIKNDAVVMNIEAGPGARQSKPDNGDADSEGLFRFSGDLAWKISKSSKFRQELSSEVGEDVTISESVSELHSTVNGNLAMKVSYSLKHTSVVPAGFDKMDRETAVTLVFSF